MDYRRELNKLKAHRKKYFPVMGMLVRMHDFPDAYDFPVDISNGEKMATLLELIDVGYLDAEAFLIEKEFGDITGLRYNGEYPLTESGEFVFRDHCAHKGKLVKILVLALSVLTVILFIIAFKIIF